MSALAVVVLIGTGAFLGWFLTELSSAPLMPDDYDPEPAPRWGCACCQDEAEEIAVLEAWWAAS